VHPAQHRALRELWAVSGAVERHARTVATQLDDRHAHLATTAGGVVARLDVLRGELRPALRERDLHADLAAEAAGRLLVTPRPALEVGQAVRLALTGTQHVLALLELTSALAAEQDDDRLRGLLSRQAGLLGTSERELRRALTGLARTPDVLVQRLDRSPVGAAGHAAAVTAGAVGEWVDRRVGRLRRS
jgi:hypothetical protein